MLVLLQKPSIVQPPYMAVFMESNMGYSLHKADEEIASLKLSLEAKGIRTHYISELISEEIDNNVPVDKLRNMVLKIMNIHEMPLKKREIILKNIDSCNRFELSNIIFNQPSLHLEYDEHLSNISPDSMYEYYKNQPLFGLQFPRDHFINVCGQLIFGSLIRLDRRRESLVIKEVISALGYNMNTFEGFLEGGDYQENSNLSIINVGFRTSTDIVNYLMINNCITKKFFIVVEDILQKKEQFHLDHYLCLQEKSVLLDSSRADDVNKSKVSVYEQINGSLHLIYQNMSLKKVFEILDYKIISLLNSDLINFSANSLFIDDNIWIEKLTSKYVINQLELTGISINQLNFNEHYKQFGGIHCSTQVIKNE